MKVTLNWLKQYVDFNGSPEDLADRLTMLGPEVEEIRKLAGDFEGVVVAQVITRDRHPNADKLSVCRVHDGQGERQIVCGAQNFQAGDKIPLVLPGATLPGPPGEKPFTIKVGKIRGVESHGMMCSGRELGLSEDHAGLYLLPPDAVIGQPLAEHLGRVAGDVLYDLEITPNRPDLNSVIGIAREVAAQSGGQIRLPQVTLPAAAPGLPRAADLVEVRIDAPDLCPRYTARVICGVKVGPSPAWLKSALEKVGLRSINNVVDVTNYVMLETGQPLHAFDYRLIARNAAGKPTIVVRRAQPGEAFTTLDGQSHQLAPDTLLIADEEKGIALAGVMGGLNSEINDRTEDVLIESAYFAPTGIRRTSKTLGLRTDASYRFERGADPGNTDWASQRCVQLLLETGGGQLADGVVDAYPEPIPTRRITLRHHQVNALLGIVLEPAQVEYYLSQLGLRIVGRKATPVDANLAPEPVTVQIPTFRVDLKRETDLIEEVARLYGVDKIPATPPRGAIGSHPFDAVFDQHAEVRRLLVGLGLHEAQGQTLVSEAAARPFSPNLVPLQKPLSSDMNVLRPSLLPGLLDSLRHNLNRKNERVALFEIGRVFLPGQTQPAESLRLAIALTGPRQPEFWAGDDREARFDAYDLKGLLEEFLEKLGLRGVAWVRSQEVSSVFLESASLALGGKVPLGQFGQLLPALARQYDLRDPVLLAELDLNQLLVRRTATRTFKPLPAFPSIRRDLAMIVGETVTHDAVLETIRSAKPQYLERIDLFDVFRGKTVPAGHKSVAYAFTYRHAERTLTDAEVNATHERVAGQLVANLPAQVRG
ncbi:MAG: phenylalanine--tRNA ligase subunit beta [Verrucomicrobia bacterium]|nr:phenylalanine--tRNA ligase subunit beta [Verrucomicrobiota bacterium]